MISSTDKESYIMGQNKAQKEAAARAKKQVAEVGPTSDAIADLAAKKRGEPEQPKAEVKATPATPALPSKQVGGVWAAISTLRHLRVSSERQLRAYRLQESDPVLPMLVRFPHLLFSLLSVHCLFEAFPESPPMRAPSPVQVWTGHQVPSTSCDVLQPALVSSLPLPVVWKCSESDHCHAQSSRVKVRHS